MIGEMWRTKCHWVRIIWHVEIFQLQITYFSINLGNYQKLPVKYCCLPGAGCLLFVPFFLARTFKTWNVLWSLIKDSALSCPLSSLWHYSAEKKCCECCLPTLCGGISSSNKVCLKSPGKDPKASSAHSPGRSVPGLMRQTLDISLLSCWKNFNSIRMTWQSVLWAVHFD